MNVSTKGYVHGYDSRESERPWDQAGTLVDLLHADTSYPARSTVLEAGCGVGAQTVTLAQRSPGAQFTSVDISAASVMEASKKAEAAGLSNVRFQQADLFALPFAAESFDHVFVCFVLEHLSKPVEALAVLGRILKPGGSMTVIEGVHGSAYFHPDSSAAREAIGSQIELQRLAGGNALIGRQLYPLMIAAGFGSVRVSPRQVYVDSGRPGLADGFTRKTFTAMIEGVREPAIAAGITTPEAFDAGVRDLQRAAEQDGVFCYTFLRVWEKRSRLFRNASQNATLRLFDFSFGETSLKRLLRRQVNVLLALIWVPALLVAAPPTKKPAAQTVLGTAVYYNDRMNGRNVALKGERYDSGDLTAATHTAFPLGCKVRVTNLTNHKSVVVRVNDRMSAKSKMTIDLSRKAAETIDIIKAGHARVRIEMVSGPPHVSKTH